MLSCFLNRYQPIVQQRLNLGMVLCQLFEIPGLQPVKSAVACPEAAIPMLEMQQANNRARDGAIIPAGNGFHPQSAVHLVERRPHILHEPDSAGPDGELLESADDQCAGPISRVASADPVSDRPKSNFTATEDRVFIEPSNESDMSGDVGGDRQPAAGPISNWPRSDGPFHE